MKNKQNGFIIPAVFSAIALLIAGSGIYLYFKGDSKPLVSASTAISSSTVSVSLSKNATSTSALPITIKNSGSTNIAGFSLVVKPDGSGIMNINNSHTASSSIKQIPVGVLDYQTLQQDLATIPSMQWQTSCAKSVSFGSTLKVVYNGEISSDVTCSPNTQPYLDLLDIANTLVKQAE